MNKMDETPPTYETETATEYTETVLVSADISEEVARHVQSLTEFRRNCGDEVDIQDLLLDYVDFDTIYTVNGVPIEEWSQKKTDSD
jgi:hypothetical protein